MNRSNTGFTVIEMLVVITALTLACVLFFTQKDQLDATRRDNNRKVAINAMYYNLEEVYFEKHRGYPTSIDSKTLRAMDPDLFKDPSGNKLGEPQSSYRYEPTNCFNNLCKSYSLRADLEREADFVKESRNK